MINHILIKDFAIIENTEIQFKDGLNIITGETGAGKSIVVEAISLALGSRADSSFVRYGKNKALIQLAATIDGEEHVLTREISNEGKNLCRIDGALVTLNELAALAKQVAEIHGQYDNQKLLDEEEHLKLVDSFGTKETAKALEDFQMAYHLYKTTRADLENLIQKAGETEKMKDFYGFEIDEIDKVSPRIGEDEELKERISLQHNSEKIFGSVESAYQLMEEGDAGLLSTLGNIQQTLFGLSGISKELSDVESLISDAYYSLQDASSTLSSIRDKLNFSPEELDRDIARLNFIDNLKKKHGDSIETVLAYRDKASEELLSLENFDSEKEALSAELKACMADLKEKASRLTDVRTKVARDISQKIEAELKELNFSDASFNIEISPAPAITSTGADQARIMITTNKGEPPKPLVKTISGGEMSRVMLAIKNVSGSFDKTPSMIFDEIDAGISGFTASVVGRKLRELARDHQLICITHLPQIAACGDENFRIYKESDDSSTYTHVEALEGDARINEIARLLGGETITQTARDNALELIKNSI